MVLSIVAATTFWFFNALNKDYAATINYPVVFDYDREQFIATAELPDQVQINVSGIGWTIFRSGYLFDAQPIFIPVENPERDSKILGASLFEDLSEGLSNLELNYVLDDTIRLNVESIVEKKVMLYLDSTSIQLEKDHYLVSPITLEFDSVRLEGPRSYVDQIGDTLMLSLGDRAIDENFAQDVNIPTRDLVTADSTSVGVFFLVEPYVNVQQPIPLTLQNFPDERVSLADTTLMVSYYIRESEAENPPTEEFIIVVDYNRMVPYDSTIQPLIMRYPSNIRRLTINSRRAKVISR